MKKTSLLVFDLDGTLVDSLPSLAKAFNQTLEELECPKHSLKDYKQIIGDGAEAASERCLPENRRTREDIKKCLDLFRIHYENLWHEAKPFPGILDLLLKNASQNKLAVLSNKDDSFTKLCVEKFFPGIFDFVTGYKKKNGLKPGPKGLLEIMAAARRTNNETCMIGDTATDIRTAVNSGTKSIGVLWGYRNKKELVEAGATYTSESAQHLSKLLSQRLT
ncbi:MAG: hypothetical protein CMQ40_11995 [Gammaproteobacteria bacterium]|nr:hypothetical protein [Gammaproteobacteria bacterium]